MTRLPDDLVRQLERVPPDLREVIERAARSGLDPKRLAEAEAFARDRDRKTRRDALVQLNRLADAALSGAYGAAAAAAASAALAGGRTRAALEKISAVVSEAKKRRK